jgi:hypothetical protein
MVFGDQCVDVMWWTGRPAITSVALLARSSDELFPMASKRQAIARGCCSTVGGMSE